VDRLNII